MIFGNIDVGENLKHGHWKGLESIAHLFPDWKPGTPYEGYQIEFPNGYSASIIRTPFSYGGPAGLWELAVLKDGGITYDTPITENVLGHLDEQKVYEALLKIERLGNTHMPGKQNHSYHEYGPSTYKVLGFQKKGWPSKVKNPLTPKVSREEYLSLREMPLSLQSTHIDAAWYQNNSNTAAFIFLRMADCVSANQVHPTN